MAKATILLVQNAKTNGNGTKRYLEGTGFDVVWTGSGVAALAAAKQQTVDLILLDAALPDIEATELCNLFRMRDRTGTVPILMLTPPGYAPNGSNGKGRGPDEYLSKPYTVKELDIRLAALLRLKTPSAGREPEQLPDLPPPHRPLVSPAPIPIPIPEPALALAPTPAPELVSTPEKGSRPRQARQTGTAPPAEKATAPAATPATESSSPSTEHHQQPNAPDGSSSSMPTTAGAGEALLPPQATVHETGSEPKAADHSVSEQKGSEVIDAATGLFGRSQFEAMFSKEFKRSVRFKQNMSCMLIDLDGRQVGREADEATLRAIVGLVQSTIREVDTAAWWSGEALIVLLPNTIRNDAVQAAARVLETVANHPFTWPDSSKVTMSIGIAGLPDRKIDTEQKLIDAAAAACRRARGFIEP